MSNLAESFQADQVGSLPDLLGFEWTLAEAGIVEGRFVVERHHLAEGEVPQMIAHAGPRDRVQGPWPPPSGPASHPCDPSGARHHRQGLHGRGVQGRLPLDLRRSLASTNIIESMNAFVGRAVHWKARSSSSLRQVCRNVKRWRDTQMALRWTAAGMVEAAKDFRRLKACKQLPILKAALEKHRDPETGAQVDPRAEAA